MFLFLKDLRETLEKELDFINEGKNSERCFKELKHLKYVHVPRVHWDKSSNRILTMEFIHGVKISDLEGIKKLGLDLKDVCLFTKFLFEISLLLFVYL